MLKSNNLVGFGVGGEAAEVVPISFVGSYIFATRSDLSKVTSLTSLSGGIGSAPIEDDLVVVFAGGVDNVIASIVTSGYTSISLRANDTYDSYTVIGYKVMGATPDTTVEYAQSTNGADSVGIVIFVFRGVDPSTPLDVSHQTKTSSNTVLANPPAITPVTSGAWVISGGAGGHIGGEQTYTSSDLTSFISAGKGFTKDFTIGAGFDSSWTSGAVDPAVFGFTGTSATTNSYSAFTLALRPA